MMEFPLTANVKVLSALKKKMKQKNNRKNAFPYQTQFLTCPFFQAV